VSETGDRAVARVDSKAIERNCKLLASKLEGRTQLCAVVKADGYGHGATAAARAALDGGATTLAVAAAAEAEALRPSFPEVAILVLGALTGDELRRALAAGAEVTVWRERFRALVSSAAESAGTPARVHVKHDSGMGRLGEPDPEAVLELVQACAEDPNIELGGFCTHFATADEEDPGFMEQQLGRFEPLVETVRAEHSGVTVHAANSAATLREPRTHFDMVRCGIAIYGMDPFQSDPAEQGLEPALALCSYVADVKRFAQGTSAGYGRSWRAERDTWVGVLPIGYGDGVRRGLSNNAEVLIGGDRYPVVGTVSMDNLTVDLGPETEIESGAPAVLIGRQGEEEILAEDWARSLETINYEVTCGISSRVPRVPAE
jgi:alanine racemase